MDIISTLNEKLLKQSFDSSRNNSVLLNEYQSIAHRYSRVENSIAVLSDLKSNRSYIYNGGIAPVLGLGEKDSIKEINSIWEEDIFNKIHPDDLVKKHILELHFFQLLKILPIEERCNYHIISRMRMCNKADEYIPILHRMFYISSCTSGNLWLAICLYNHSYEKSGTMDGMIVNSANGETIDINEHDKILSNREREILSLIGEGKTSKEIAALLYISKNTVDRHRQNIMEKLRVRNSTEAIHIARQMNLL